MSLYKDDLVAVQERLDVLLRESPDGGRPSTVLVSLYARRVGRTWAGVVGLAAFAGMTVDLACGGRLAAWFLLGSWVLMAAAYGAAFGVAWLAVRRLVRRMSARAAGDPYLQVAELERGTATSTLLARVERLQHPSVGLMLAVMSLMGPLTLHLIVGLICAGTSVAKYSNWILLSYVLVGHAHLAVVLFGQLHVSAVRRELAFGMEPQGGVRGVRALGWTTLISALPGIVLFCIPPALVFLTGIILLPAMFAWAARCLTREHGVFEAFSDAAATGR